MIAQHTPLLVARNEAAGPLRSQPYGPTVGLEGIRLGGLGPSKGRNYFGSSLRPGLGLVLRRGLKPHVLAVPQMLWLCMLCMPCQDLGSLASVIWLRSRIVLYGSRGALVMLHSGKRFWCWIRSMGFRFGFGVQVAGG